jgi:hypothetical protein
MRPNLWRLVSPPGTGASAPLPTVSYGLARYSRTREVRFTERPESFHRPLAFEEPSPLGEKMEERLEAPSVVSTRLPASADPRGVSATHTRRLAAPDRAIRHAVPVTFGRDACAPFRSDTGPTRHLCGVHLAPCDAWPHRLSLPTRSRGGRLPSVSADRAVCDRLTRPPAACLATVRGARARCVRPTSASHTVFDYEHSRRVRSQHLFEACTSPLRPGLAPRTRETGGPGGSRRRIRFSGWLQVFTRRFFFRALPVLPCF